MSSCCGVSSCGGCGPYYGGYYNSCYRPCGPYYGGWGGSYYNGCGVSPYYYNSCGYYRGGWC